MQGFKPHGLTKRRPKPDQKATRLSQKLHWIKKFNRISTGIQQFKVNARSTKGQQDLTLAC
jgi:hypothetical protein